ncbi:hypothetical protein [Candidatus Sodalis pierantonius]|uniref:hypothetical protein n=1 Tax=Candidatus Sodalis pierantonii TaxID=1486991 RepID=UPI0011DCEE3D|nr:hypothetical protein [Candidatus Sodalis pierantonius]
MLANDPVRQFGMALDAWRSRRQLAQDAIVNRCPELAHADAAKALQADTESYLNAHGPWHCSCPPPGEPDLPPLPDIDGRFEEQNAELARHYATVDLLILSNTFARLDEVERDFIRLAQVTFARAERSPVAAFSAFELSGLHHSGQSVVDLVLELLPGVELLLARHQQEERIYALQLQEGRYLLSRVDRNDSRYHNLFPAPRHYRYKRYDLKIHEQQERLKQPGAPLEALAMTLATHHQTQFSTHLYQQGYDATFREQALDFLLSLVPFYDCVRLLSRGETANALLPCAFDALALVPVVGEASAISLHFGSALGRGGLFAVRRAVKVMACEQLLAAARYSCATASPRAGARGASTGVGGRYLSRADGFRAHQPVQRRCLRDQIYVESRRGAAQSAKKIGRSSAQYPHPGAGRERLQGGGAQVGSGRGRSGAIH